MESDKVKIKGTRDGFRLIVDGEVPYPEIEEKAGVLFSNISQFASGARVYIDLKEDGPDDEALVEKLGSFLKDRFGVSQIMVRPEETPPMVTIPETRGSETREQESMDNVKLLSGRVRSGQKITAENHLVILGDVNPGAEVIAGGDILILGSLCGTAVAGQGNTMDSIILALDFRPTQVQIAGLVAAGASTATGKETEYAFIENGAIVVDKYGTSGPFGKLPVLTQR